MQSEEGCWLDRLFFSSSKASRQRRWASSKCFNLIFVTIRLFRVATVRGCNGPGSCLLCFHLNANTPSAVRYASSDEHSQAGLVGDLLRGKAGLVTGELAKAMSRHL